MNRRVACETAKIGAIADESSVRKEVGGGT